MAEKWVPLIDPDCCTGCNRCVEACGSKSLALINGLAVLVLPQTCGSEEHCVSACPEGAIRMTWVPLDGARHVGRWRT